MKIMTKALNILTVDDEPLARRRLRKMLAGETRVGEIREAADGDEAFEMIVRLKPDLVYLDIQMPGCNGFELLERLRAHPHAPAPVIIFVTACDEFALKAFEFHALDYLLKPFDRERFAESFDFAARQIAAGARDDYQAKLRRLVESLPPPAAAEKLEWVSVKKDDKILLFKVDEIVWIVAQGNYVSVQLGQIKHLLREKMDSLAARLDAEKFIRIHRSAIINVNFITEIEVWGRGEYKIVMSDGRVFNVSRHFRSNLDSFFQRKVI